MSTTTDPPKIDGVVYATCRECGDEHPLAHRHLDGPNDKYLGASVCPECGSVRYETTFDGKRDHPRPRLREALDATEGVGETLAIRALQWGMEAGWDPTVDGLATVDGVSKRMARRIVDNYETAVEQYEPPSEEFDEQSNCSSRTRTDTLSEESSV